MRLAKRSILGGPQAAGSRAVMGLGDSQERSARVFVNVAAILRCGQEMA